MMKYIFLYLFVVVSSVQAEYIVSDKEDVILDVTTLFVWQDSNETKDVRKTFNEAIRYCKDLELAGFSDWRLPNFNELYLLADRKLSSPSLPKEFKNYNINTIQDFYWSSTTNSENNSSAWGVHFQYGNSTIKDKNEIANIRCVRDSK